MHLINFISYLEHEKRYSPNTVISYRNDLTQFLNYLDKTYALNDVKDLKHFHLRSWIVSLVDADITPRSVNRKISSIKSYFKFLRRSKWIETDPTTKIISPKTSKRLPSYVEKSGTDKLLNDMQFEEGFSGIRDKLMLEILYVSGMRLSELINLRESDINIGRKDVKVLGKGNKQRIIPVNQKLLDNITLYLELRNALFSNEFLLVTDSGKKLYPKFVYRKVNQYLGMVTTVDKKSPHTMRHTFATHLLNSGADINAVKELLGHSSLAATQVYTHNSIEKLKDIYKNAHPKA